MELSNKKKRKALEAVLREHLLYVRITRGTGHCDLCRNTRDAFIEGKINHFQSMFIQELVEEHTRNNSSFSLNPKDHESRTKWLGDQIEKLKL